MHVFDRGKKKAEELTTRPAKQLKLYIFEEAQKQIVQARENRIHTKEHRRHSKKKMKINVKYYNNIVGGGGGVWLLLPAGWDSTF